MLDIHIVSSSSAVCKQLPRISGIAGCIFYTLFQQKAYGEDDFMKRYKKRPDGRYAITIMIGYKPNGKPNNIFLSAKTEKELRDKVIEVRMKIKSGQASNNLIPYSKIMRTVGLKSIKHPQA